jgi:hypothetical protein
MERIALPLSQFSYAQKLDLMETLWDDISKDEQAFESPNWHESVLQERQEALSTGRVKHSDWSEAKERIKRNVSCG